MYAPSINKAYILLGAIGCTTIETLINPNNGNKYIAVIWKGNRYTLYDMIGVRTFCKKAQQ